MSYTTRVVEAGKDEIFQLHGKVEKVRNRDGDGVAVTVRFTDLGQKLITLPEVGVTYEIIGIGKGGHDRADRTPIAPRARAAAGVAGDLESRSR